MHVLLTDVSAVIVGNGEHMWYLSQVKGPAEDDSVEGGMIAHCIQQTYGSSVCCYVILFIILLDLWSLKKLPLGSALPARFIHCSCTRKWQ